jgi:hypothetical protein
MANIFRPRLLDISFSHLYAENIQRGRKLTDVQKTGNHLFIHTFQQNNFNVKDIQIVPTVMCFDYS